MLTLATFLQLCPYYILLSFFAAIFLIFCFPHPQLLLYHSIKHFFSYFPLQYLHMLMQLIILFFFSLLGDSFFILSSYFLFWSPFTVFLVSLTLLLLFHMQLFPKIHSWHYQENNLVSHSLYISFTNSLVFHNKQISHVTKQIYVHFLAIYKWILMLTPHIQKFFSKQILPVIILIRSWVSEILFFHNTLVLFPFYSSICVT